MVDNPSGEPSNILLRSNEALMRRFERAPGIEMDRQPQLIAKLLGKSASGEPVSYAMDELTALFRAEFAMLQASAHQSPRPVMPMPFGLGANKLNAFPDCSGCVQVVGSETVRKAMQFALAQRVELSRAGVSHAVFAVQHTRSPSLATPRASWLPRLVTFSFQPSLHRVDAPV